MIGKQVESCRRWGAGSTIIKDQEAERLKPLFLGDAGRRGASSRVTEDGRAYIHACSVRRLGFSLVG